MSRLDMQMGVGTEQPYIIAVTRDPDRYGYRDEYIVSGGHGSTGGVDWPAIGLGGVDDADLRETTRYLAAAYNACHKAGLDEDDLAEGVEKKLYHVPDKIDKLVAQLQKASASIYVAAPEEVAKEVDGLLMKAGTLLSALNKRCAKLASALTEYGICADCGTPFRMGPPEEGPFASCDCCTSEWTGTPPKIDSMETELRSLRKLIEDADEQV